MYNMWVHLQLDVRENCGGGVVYFAACIIRGRVAGDVIWVFLTDLDLPHEIIELLVALHPISCSPGPYYFAGQWRKRIVLLFLPSANRYIHSAHVFLQLLSKTTATSSSHCEQSRWEAFNTSIEFGPSVDVPRLAGHWNCDNEQRAWISCTPCNKLHVHRLIINYHPGAYFITWIPWTLMLLVFRVEILDELLSRKMVCASILHSYRFQDGGWHLLALW